MLARLRIRSIDRVAADAERLDQRELFQRELARRMQLASRQHELRTQPTVGMHAEHLQLLATIAVAAPTGVALTTIHVRLDRAAVAGLHVGHAAANLDDFDAQFMPRNARVAVKRHLAEIPTDVRPANADAMHSHERLTGTGPVRFGNLDVTKLSGLFELDGFHGGDLNER